MHSNHEINNYVQTLIIGLPVGSANTGSSIENSLINLSRLPSLGRPVSDQSSRLQD